MAEPVKRDVIAIGASEGGFRVLMDLVARLPQDVPAAILVVLHIGSFPSRLPELFNARGPNPAVHPYSGQPVRPGTIYVAPPDHHMRVHDASIRLSRGAREHHARPAIDPLFRSVAIDFGTRAVGVILSGRLDDGTAGALAIKQCGGMIVVQDPGDAEQPSMPASVCEHVRVDRCVVRSQLAATLLDVIGTQAVEPVVVPAAMLCEQRISEGEAHPMEDLNHLGKPSAFTCPDCEGVLWEIAGSQPRRFRCHTGHAFSLRSLEHTHAINTNQTLWSALRALQEREALLAELISDNRQRSHAAEATQLEAELREVSEQTVRLEQMVVDGRESAPDAVAD